MRFISCSYFSRLSTIRSYKDNVYTTNEVGFEGLKHIKSDAAGHKDFSAVISQVGACFLLDNKCWAKHSCLHRLWP